MSSLRPVLAAAGMLALVAMGAARASPASNEPDASGAGARALAGLASGALPAGSRVSTGGADGLWEELVVPAVNWSSAIYDPLRHRLVVFGGYDDGGNYVNGVWALSLAGEETWTVLTPAGPRPSARYGHSAIYDPIRDRMIVFGGYDSAPDHDRNDIWALSMGGVPEWRELVPDGTPPGGRSGHSAIYDPVRDRMVVFGGRSLHFAARGDAWALDLAEVPTWTALAPGGPSPGGRSNHSAVYDPVRDRMLLFGGLVGSQSVSNEVWALGLAETTAWTAVLPVGEPAAARSQHCAIYDPVRDRMLVVGGSDAGTLRNDVCSLSLSGIPAWSTLAPAGAPPTPRNAASAVYEPVGDRFVTYGGYDGTRRNDTWALALSNAPAWVELTPTVVPPAAREYHSATYDPVRDRMIVFGGTGFSALAHDDVWALSFAGAPAWKAMAPAGSPPAGRAAHSAIYDPVRDRVVMFGGGESFADHRNDVWALSLAGGLSWEAITPAGTPPRKRAYHAAIYDPIRDRMLVFGGEDSTFTACDDTWALSFTGTLAWTALETVGAPPGARRGHSAIYDPVRDRMLVFGGGSGLWGPPAYYFDVWALSLSGAPAWTPLGPVGTPPSPQAFHSAIYDPVRDRMIVYGAWTSADTWELGLSGGTEEWRALAPANPPPNSRVFHSAIFDPVRERMIVFGGARSAATNDTWALRTGAVLDVESGGEPRARGFLGPPAPNPSTGTTAVRYSLVRAGRVQLGIYDLSGRLVRTLVNREQAAGTEVVRWDGTGENGTSLGTGVYFIRLAGPGFHETRKVVLVR